MVSFECYQQFVLPKYQSVCLQDNAFQMSSQSSNTSECLFFKNYIFALSLVM